MVMWYSAARSKRANLQEVGCKAVNPLPEVCLGGCQVTAGVLASYGTSLLQICCLCHILSNCVTSLTHSHACSITVVWTDCRDLSKLWHKSAANMLAVPCPVTLSHVIDRHQGSMSYVQGMFRAAF